MRRTLAVAAGAAVSLIALSGTALAAGTTLVSADDLGTAKADCGGTQSGWCTYDQGTGSVGLADSATGTPAGQHLQLTTPTSSDKAGAYEYDNRGKDLSKITTLSYSYLVTDRPTTGSGPDWAPSMNVEIVTADGHYGVLVYEPLYVAGHQTPTTRTWTTETPTTSDGGWWVTHLQDGPTGLQVSQTANPGVYGGATWAEVEDHFEGATVLGIGINQGSGNAGLTSQVDLLTVNGTTYDFAGTPQTADDCKNGSWQSYAERAFPNQGQCIQFVNTGKVGTANAPSGETLGSASGAAQNAVSSAAARPTLPTVASVVATGKMRAA